MPKEIRIMRAVQYLRQAAEQLMKDEEAGIRQMIERLADNLEATNQ